MNHLSKMAKGIADWYNGISLILRIALGLLIGALLGIAWPHASWLEEFGTLFVGALKGIAPVLVFVIVASALAQGSSTLDRRFGTVVWLYLLTTFVAAVLSVLTSALFPVKLVLPEAASADVIPQGLGEVMRTLLSNIVANPIASIMNGNYIGILMWACLFGIAMKKFASPSSKEFLANTADALSEIVRFIINLAPFGIMGLVFANVSSNGLAIFPIPHGPRRHWKGLAVRPHALQGIPPGELIAQAACCKALFIAGFHHGHNLPLPDVTGGLGVLPGLAVVEAGGIHPVGDVLYFVTPHRVRGLTLENGIDAVPVSAGDDGGIVAGFGPALQLDAVHARVHQVVQVVDHAHIPGI